MFHRKFIGSFICFILRFIVASPNDVAVCAPRLAAERHFDRHLFRSSVGILAVQVAQAQTGVVSLAVLFLDSVLCKGAFNVAAVNGTKDPELPLIVAPGPLNLADLELIVVLELDRDALEVKLVALLAGEAKGLGIVVGIFLDVQNLAGEVDVLVLLPLCHLLKRFISLYSLPLVTPFVIGYFFVAGQLHHCQKFLALLYVKQKADDGH